MTRAPRIDRSHSLTIPALWLRLSLVVTVKCGLCWAQVNLYVLAPSALCARKPARYRGRLPYLKFLRFNFPFCFNVIQKYLRAINISAIVVRERVFLKIVDHILFQKMIQNFTSLLFK